MTIEADLFTTLRALAADRVYPDLAPSGAAAPYIVYQEISGEAPVFLERAVPSKKHGRFQITVWAATRMEASTLILQVDTLCHKIPGFIDADPAGRGGADALPAVPGQAHRRPDFRLRRRHRVARRAPGLLGLVGPLTPSHPPISGMCNPAATERPFSFPI